MVAAQTFSVLFVYKSLELDAKIWFGRKKIVTGESRSY
jgi:hypothetical protein